MKHLKFSLQKVVGYLSILVLFIAVGSIFYCKSIESNTVQANSATNDEQARYTLAMRTALDKNENGIIDEDEAPTHDWLVRFHLDYHGIKPAVR